VYVIVAKGKKIVIYFAFTFSLAKNKLSQLNYKLTLRIVKSGTKIVSIKKSAN